jgi:hypothetical protein
MATNASPLQIILTEIANRLSDAVASLDALEAELETSGVLPKDAIGNRFQTHKGTVESHLSNLRRAISQLK